MRRLIVSLLASAIALAVSSYLIAGFHITPTWDTYLVGSLLYLALSYLVGPVIKLLLLPLNLLTLGLFRWVSSVLVFYLFDLLYQGVSVRAYDFGGLNTQVLSLPPGHVTFFWTLVLSTLVMSLTYSLFSSLFSSE